MSTDLSKLPVHALADKLKSRSVSPVDLAQKLISAGMIIIGRTHMVEFALGGWGTNQHLGTPWNPWDGETHRIPGGSSSGSAVAVIVDLTLPRKFNDYPGNTMGRILSAEAYALLSDVVDNDEQPIDDAVRSRVR